VNTNSVNNVKIQLIPKIVSGSFATGTGGNVNVSGGGTVSFVASSVANATTKVAYTGDVSVSTFYLNPADANFKEYMPGDLRGINSSNQESILNTFGMLSLEMDDASGEKLQLAAGKTATITLPIPSAMQANAPATIPLWYFDETKGFWKQEGSASKQGTNYVGTVAHFSFWASGQLQQSVKLDAAFKDSTGKFLANKLVTITSTVSGTTNDYTDSAGTVSGLIPANETLVMKVSDECGGIIYTKEIGPFNADTNLGSITVTITASNSITLSGTVVNCSNVAVTNGYVQVNIGSNHFNSAIINGNFSITFSRCSNSVTPDSIIAYDAANKQQSIPRSIDTVKSNQNIGKIIACILPNPPKASFNYTVGGTVLPITVTFTNSSQNATSYLWDFGDGSNSTVANPVHIYTTVGYYNVKLIASGSGGDNTTIQIIHITTISNGPDSSFINLTMNGTTYSWTYPDSVSALHSIFVDTSGGGLINHTQVQGGAGQKYINFFIDNDNALPGNYNIALNLALSSTAYFSNGATTAVTEYGAIGGYISGTSLGQVTQLDSTTNIPFTMSYRVRRFQ